jgi:DNA-binding NarL/FixJ family response regulator
MNAFVDSALQHARTGLLVVDPDHLFQEDVVALTAADENIDILATAEGIEDAFHSALRLAPDVIMIGWGPEVRPFVNAVDSMSGDGLAPHIVIVITGDILSTPGLGSLLLRPEVSLVVRSQLPQLLPRLSALHAERGLLH